MSRTSRYKLIYVAVIVGAIVVSASVVVLLDIPRWLWLVAAIVLLVSGRIQGHYYRTFFRGRRLLADERPQEAIPCFEAFLNDLRSRPWLKRLIWLSWGTYTRDVEVMTLNNLGVARLSLGDLDGAERDLRAASALDPHAPLPYFNLGLVQHARGNDAAYQELLDKARVLGYRGTLADRAIHAAGTALARVEGRGGGKIA